MKQWERKAAVVGMIFLILSLLLTSFQIAIYGDPQYKFYEKEYVKYQVTETLDMELTDVMYVTGEMMDYLIGKKPELSVITTVEGKEQDFFNEQDRFHMGEVKNLFLGGLKLRNLFALVFVILLVLIIKKKKDWKKILPGAYFRALAICGGTAALLGGIMSVNFNRCFVIFHKIFFRNDLWIFDPDTDYMIRMLPEGFFYDMVMRIGMTFFCILAILSLIFGIWKYIVYKKGL